MSESRHASDEFGDDRARDSLLLLAEVLAIGEAWVAKIRNISAGGLMAEPCRGLTQGETITITLPNLGLVRGQVAWVAAPRFGVEFAEKVDPLAVRGSVPAAPTSGLSNRSKLLRRI